jgi:hypothetical protein
MTAFIKILSVFASLALPALMTSTLKLQSAPLNLTESAQIANFVIALLTAPPILTRRVPAEPMLRPTLATIESVLFVRNVTWDLPTNLLMGPVLLLLIECAAILLYVLTVLIFSQLQPLLRPTEYAATALPSAWQVNMLLAAQALATTKMVLTEAATLVLVS